MPAYDVDVTIVPTNNTGDGFFSDIDFNVTSRIDAARDHINGNPNGTNEDFFWYLSYVCVL